VNLPLDRIDVLERPILPAGMLTDALELTLDSHAMLAQAAARYQLSTDIVAVDGPVFGEFDLRIGVTAQYVLRERRTGRSVFVRRFSTTRTESLLNAFPNFSTLRMAYEGAIRANIAAFVTRLAEDFRRPGRRAAIAARPG